MSEEDLDAAGDGGDCIDKLSTNQNKFLFSIFVIFISVAMLVATITALSASNSTGPSSTTNGTTAGTGACCLPPSGCDVTKAGHGFGLTRYNFCDITQEDADRMGCPSAFKQVQECSLTESDYCTANQNQVVLTLLVVVSLIVASIFFLSSVSFLLLRKNEEWIHETSTCYKISGLGLLLCALFVIPGVILSGVMMKRVLISPFMVELARHCIDRKKRKHCDQYDYASMSSCPSSIPFFFGGETMNGKTADRFFWWNNFQEMQFPIVVLLILHTGILLFFVGFLIRAALNKKKQKSLKRGNSPAAQKKNNITTQKKKEEEDLTALKVPTTRNKKDEERIHQKFEQEGAEWDERPSWEKQEKGHAKILEEALL